MARLNGKAEAGLVLLRSMQRLMTVYRLVDTQANDARLWQQADTEREVYLQRQLRRLHEALEAIE